MNEPKIINVVYECIDGAHIFSSTTDPFVCGLYAASTDLREAYDDVPIQAKALLKLNHGIDSEVTHAVPYEDFLKRLLSAITRALVTKNRGVGRGSLTGVLPPSSAASLRMEVRAAA